MKRGSNVRVTVEGNLDKSSELISILLPVLNESSITRGNITSTEEDLNDAHLVLSESSSLIRSDHVDRAKILDDSEVLDKNISSSHALGDNEKRCSDAKRKSDREATDEETEANSDDARPRDETLVRSAQPSDIGDEASSS